MRSDNQPDKEKGERYGSDRLDARYAAPDDSRLPTISLVRVPHPRIPHLYHRCFEYVEPWQWSPATELVETGVWFFEPRRAPTALQAGKDPKQLPGPKNTHDGA